MNSFIREHQQMASGSQEMNRNATKLVVIDLAVEDSDSLIRGILPSAEAIVINPLQDGVEQITQALQNYAAVSSLHIISHGSPGCLKLGNSHLSLDSLGDYADQLKNWPVEHLLLYGCHVAAGDAGTEFIQKLSRITGAEIAASTTYTGNAALGGNWDLDVSTNEFDVELALTPEVQASYGGVLPEAINDLITETINFGEVGITYELNGVTYSFRQGDGNDIEVDGFTLAGGEEFLAGDTLDRFELRRVNNAEVTGDRELVWFEQAPGSTEANVLIRPQYTDVPFTNIMEAALFGEIINRGTDNVFSNVGNDQGNNNNIERVDYISDNPLSVTINPDNAGFLILERGGNDDFQIAVITELDGNGDPAAYGPLVNNGGVWGQSSTLVTTEVLRRDEAELVDANDNRLGFITTVDQQAVSGVYFSFTDLGLTQGENFFGYSLFAPDVPANGDGTAPVDFTTFPTDTPEDGGGGLDLIAGGVVFTIADAAPPQLDLDGDDSTGTVEPTDFTVAFAGEPVPVGDVDVVITDADSVNMVSATITLTNRLDGDDAESLAVNGPLPDGITAGNYNPATGEIILEGVASIEDYQTAINLIVYDNTSETPTTDDRIVEVVVNDGIIDSNTANAIITFAETAPPTLDLDGDDSTITGSDFTTVFVPGGEAVAIGDTDVVITDADSVNMVSATITLTERLNGDDAESLAINGELPAGITASAYDPATGVITLTGDAPIADYQTAIAQIVYNNTSGTPNTEDRIVSAVVNDGTTDSNIANAIITFAEAAPPTLDLDGDDSTIPGNDFTTVFVPGGEAVAIGDTDVVITDADSVNMVSATITLTNRLNGDDAESLAINGELPAGITASAYDPATGVITLTGDAPIADYQTAIVQIVYNNTSGTPNTEDRIVSAVVNDGTTDSNIANAIITFAEAAPPTLDLDGDDSTIAGSDFTTVFVPGGEAVAIGDTDVIITDADSVNMVSATITLTNRLNGDDAESLAINGELPAGLTASAYDPATGIITLTGDATIADYQTAINQIVYNNTAETPITDDRVVSVVVNDGTTDSNTANAIITFAETAPPTLDLDGDDSTIPGNDFTTVFVPGGTPVAIGDTDVAIGDTDSPNMVSATITLTNRLNGDDAESLSIDPTVLEGTGITASAYDPATGVITLTGDAPIATYQTVISQIVYNNTSDTPITDDRIVSAVVNDGLSDSDPPANAIITFDLGNTDPDAVDDAATTPINTVVSVPVLGNDTDPENDPLEITAIPTPPANGTAVINDNGTPEDTTDDFIDYTPNPDFTGQDTFEYTIIDGNGGTDTATVTVTVVDSAPEAVDDQDTTAPNTAVTINILRNDSDPDDGPNPLSIDSFDPNSANGGTIAFSANGTALVYTPAENFTGTDTFTYTITDGLETDTATVTINVTDAVPNAVDDRDTTAANTAVTINVLRNDSDPDNAPDPLSIDSFDPNSANGGTIGFSANGTALVYTPAEGFTGTDTFTYTITDGLQTDTATVTIDVTEVVPEAVDDESSTAANTPVTINVLGNDSDPDNGPEPLSIDSFDPNSANNGTITSSPDGTGLVYIPAPGFLGVDTFTYTITDGVATDTATVTIEVADTIPNAIDDQDSTAANTPITINVLGNDSDPDNGPDPLSIENFDPNSANGGTITPSPDGNGLVYTPAEGFTGTDTFTYTVTDGVETDTATVTVDVTDGVPTAVDDQDTTAANTPVTVNVLGNDTDPENDPLTIDGFDGTSANGGTVEPSPDGSGLVYTPAPGFLGVDTFTYTITDGVTTDTATVRINVTEGVPNAIDDEETTVLATPITVNVLGNDTDPENDPLTIEGFDGTSANGGTITPSPDGNGLIYTPAPDFLGTDTFTYTITDGVETDTATVTVTVVPPPDTAPNAVDDPATTEPGTPVNIDVTNNDVDPDGDVLTITEVSDPENGTVTIDDNGTPDDPSDDVVTYTPAEGFTGTDTFTYTVVDENGETDTATVTVTVNTAPDAVDDVTETFPETPVPINVLSNDVDPDGDILTITEVSDPENGTVTIDDNGTPDDPSDDFVTYTPNDGFEGTDTFTYTVVDENGGIDTATVTVGVPTVDFVLPDAEDDTTTININTPSTIDVTDNDSDPGGNILTITEVSDPDNGTASINDNGTPDDPSDDFIEYTPDPEFIGTDTFTYTIDNGNGGIDTATVTVTVVQPPTPMPPTPTPTPTPPTPTPTNQPPVAEELTVEGDNTGNPIPVPPLTATDPDGPDSALVYRITKLPQNGTLLLDGVEITSLDEVNQLTPDQVDGLTFIPGSGTSSIDSFCYVAVDENGAVSNEAEVSLNVDGPDVIVPDPDEDVCPCPPIPEFAGVVLPERIEIEASIPPDTIPRTEGDDSDDILLGTDDNDSVRGALGSDTLEGAAGDDSLFGGVDDFLDPSIPRDDDDLEIVRDVSGSDQIDGEAGDDFISANESNDTVTGGEGNDTAYAGQDDDVVFGDEGNDVLFGDDGNDTIIGGNGDGDVITRSDEDSVPDNDTIYGYRDDDVLVGGPDADVIFSGKGNDFTFGGESNDAIWGDLGEDTLYGDEGNDTMFGDTNLPDQEAIDGSDLMWGGSGDDLMNGNRDNDTLSGGIGNDTVRGGQEDDLLFGDVGNDLMFGDQGNDHLCGNEGDDTLFGDEMDGAGNDTLCGGSGDDVLLADEGDDILEGTAGNDTLYGGEGVDTVEGGSGEDWLFGDEGSDILKGDSGSDRFVFIGGNSGTDTILDFQLGQDIILLGGGLSFNDLTFTQSGTATVITANDQDLAILEGISINLLDDANNFGTF